MALARVRPRKNPATSIVLALYLNRLYLSDAAEVCVAAAAAAFPSAARSKDSRLFDYVGRLECRSRAGMHFFRRPLGGTANQRLMPSLISCRVAVHPARIIRICRTSNLWTRPYARLSNILLRMHLWKTLGWDIIVKRCLSELVWVISLCRRVVNERLVVKCGTA